MVGVFNLLSSNNQPLFKKGYRSLQGHVTMFIVHGQIIKEEDVLHHFFNL